jgi:hypothetical protein
LVTIHIHMWDALGRHTRVVKSGESESVSAVELSDEQRLIRVPVA